MKKIILFCYGLSIIALISGCKKEETTPANNNTTPAVSCKPTMSIDVKAGQSNDTTFYYYNSSNKLVRMKYSYGYDTIIYNSSGQLEMIKSTDPINPSVLSVTSIYTYTGNNITQILEFEYNNSVWDTIVYTCLYSGSQLNQIISMENGDTSFSVKDIVWLNGNISTMTMDLDGTGAILLELSASHDDKKNVARHIVPQGGMDLLAWLGTNNILSAQTTQNEVIDFGFGPVPIPAGTKIFEYSTVTYTNEGEVASFVEEASLFDDPGETETTTSFTYSCQ